MRRLRIELYLLKKEKNQPQKILGRHTLTRTRPANLKKLFLHQPLVTDLDLV